MISSNTRRSLPVAALLATLAAGPAAANCGAASCALDTNWNVQGLWTGPGARFDLRYEYVKQERLRAGRDTVAIGQIPLDHDEYRTVNRNWLAILDYGFSETWGLNLAVPVPGRDHLHFDTAAASFEQWNFTALGDVRVLARYQVHAAHGAGVSFGLKLPTGRTDVTNAAGATAERSLQPGSGTTDAILGLFHRNAEPGQGLAWFAQALWQQALNRHRDFKPGNRLLIDLGLRYGATPEIGLMVQLNGVLRGRDSGLQAEPDDSGGRFLYLSPGVSYALSPDLQLYTYYQRPIYQRVNGIQLTADWSATAGVSARF